MLLKDSSVGLLWIKLFILTDLCQAFQRASNQPNQHGSPHMQSGQLPIVATGSDQDGLNLLHDKSKIHDREHIKEHLGGIINEPDLSKMSEEEAQFYYFKSHDSDHNNKLDGSELIKSIIHWHGESHI